MDVQKNACGCPPASKRRNGKPSSPVVSARPEVFHFFPQGLNLPAVLRSAGWTDEDITKYGRWAEVYVGVICDQWQWRGKRGDEFAPVWCEYLLTWLPEMNVKGGKLLARIREALSTVIEYTDYTRPDRANNIKGMCREYRLTAEYRDRLAEPHTVLSTQLTAIRSRSHDKWESVKSKLEAAWRPVHHTLREHCNQFYLPDSPAVRPHLDKYVVRRLTGREERRFTLDFQGRFHNDVVALDTALKPLLRVRNEPDAPVYSLDVKSSQMLLLLLVLTGRTTPRWEEVGAREAPWAAGTPDPAREIHWLVGSCSQTGQIDEWMIDLILSADHDIYQLIADEMNRGLPSPKYDRATAKEKTLCVVMGRPGAMEEQEAGRAIQSLFPGFFAALKRLSSRLEHGGVPRILQRMESRVMTRAAEWITAERPDIVFAPGHDCFYVAQPEGSTDRIDFALRMIKDASAAEVGIAPRVSVEPLAGKLARVKQATGKKRRNKVAKRLPTRTWLRAHKKA